MERRRFHEIKRGPDVKTQHKARSSVAASEFLQVGVTGHDAGRFWGVTVPSVTVAPAQPTAAHRLASALDAECAHSSAALLCSHNAHDNPTNLCLASDGLASPGSASTCSHLRRLHLAAGNKTANQRPSGQAAKFQQGGQRAVTPLAPAPSSPASHFVA
ncbi:hypothetical protein E4U22_005461 [Claviceps purpurea]|nr:hypothetical protein E4U38_005599 [Claviceps purpurea]KAG6169807.1 hypothetical protein E4U27_007529 [Claviceps purpurea]KAG6257545.1 hypothetical protein E4U23_003910 [Claviceps purpurea]KAG6268257.1 hypothetical protein E4U47_004800 [Claviceps purpurea]KAG6313142.1 hypothetical protein E4U44_002815 [Claviceps purpurea]